MNKYVLTYTTAEGKYVRLEMADRLAALAEWHMATGAGARNLWLAYQTPISAETIMVSPGRTTAQN